MPKLRLALAVALAVSVAVVTVTSSAGTASADPVGDLSTEAATLVSQIESTSQSITALSQQYDGAELSLQQAQQAAGSDAASMTLLRTRVTKLEHLIHERAVSDYEASLSGQTLPLPDLPDAQQLVTRARYAADQANEENGTLHQLESEEATLTRQEDDAQQAQATELADTQQLAAVKTLLQAANAQQTQTLSQVQGALALLVPDASQAAADAQLSIALAEFDPGGLGGDASLFPNLPPVSGVAAVAIAFARAQLGKPYLYAAAGPNSYDCSGLVMAAYGFAGVRLPHYSGAQYRDAAPRLAVRHAARRPGLLGNRRERACRHLPRSRTHPPGRRNREHRQHRAHLGPPGRRRPRPLTRPSAHRRRGPPIGRPGRRPSSRPRPGHRRSETFTCASPGPC